MDWREIPDVQFRIVQVGEANYRVPDIAKGSSLAKLSIWKSSSASKNDEPANFTEFDEPVSTYCGVDNPFAGITQDPDAS